MLKFLRVCLPPAIVFVIFIFSPLLAICQIDEPVWVNDIGGNNANTISSAVRVDGQNNIYVAGLFSGTADFDPTGGVYELTSISGTVDAFVAKYNTNGSLIWAVKMGGTGLDQVNSLAVDIDGNPTISGQFNSNDFDTDPGAGTNLLATNGGYDAFIIKLSTNGQFMWSKQIGSNETDYGGILSTDSQGNIITSVRYQGSVNVDGRQFTSQGAFNGLLIKYAANGTVLWVVSLTDSNDCQPGYTAVDKEDNIIVCGIFTTVVNFNPLGTANNIDGYGAAEFLAKYNSAGQLIWAKPIYGTVISNNGNLCVNSKGDVYLVGPFSSTLNFNTLQLSASGSQDLFLAKYSSAGEFENVTKIGGNNSVASIFNYGVWASQDDNIYISGYFSGSIDFNISPTETDLLAYHGQRDFFLAKYDENLNYKWAFGGGSANCINTMARNVVTDGNNDVVFTGGFCSTVNFSASACAPNNLTAKSSERDMFLGKYVQSRASAAGQITAFSVPQQNSPAIIDQDKLTITVTVPSGTDITALVPAITYTTNVQLNPASGTPQNFTTPVIYTLQQNCSSLNYTVQVVFEDNPPVCNPPTVNNATPVCPGQPVTLSVTAPQANLTYNWYNEPTGGTNINTGTTYTVQPTVSTDYFVEAVDGSCVSSRFMVNVSVLPAPAAPQAQDVNICAGTTATLTATVGNDVLVRWYNSETATSELSTGNAFITPVLNNSTTYYAEAVSNSGGCTSVTRTAVNVNIIAQLTAPVVTVGNATGNSVTFNWTPVTGAAGYEVSTDGGQTYSAVGDLLTYTLQSLSTNQTVTFSVRALSAAGCQAGNAGSATGTTITPKLDEIFIPNMFTPNGDGNNDILFMRGLGIKEAVFYVYDQWGELIFRSKTIANGWDGTYKGKAMPVGVYVYYVDATMLDGKKQNKKGTITLLR